MFLSKIRRNTSKRAVITFLAVVTVVCLIAGNNISVTKASFSDVETATANTLQAWSASLWTQTSQADFNAGILNNVDTASSSGDVTLEYSMLEPTTSTGAEQTWYYAAWSRRAPVTINNTGSAQTDYQVRVAVTYDSDMQADFDDIRFVDSDGATPLAHCSESVIDSTSAVFWVKIPSIPAGSKVIYMYYGNGTVGNACDGDATFPFYDNFGGASLNSNKWQTTGNITVAGGEVHINCTANGQGIAVVIPDYYFGPGYSVEYRERFGETDVTHLIQGLYEYYDAQHHATALSALADGTGCARTANDSVITETILGLYDTSYHRYQITRIFGEARYYYDGFLLVTHNTNVPPDDLRVQFTGDNTADIYLDWVFVRKYAAIEPTASVGVEDGWSRWAPVTISNPLAGLTDYQVSVDVTYDADMQPDFDDIRFFDSDGITPLGHWRESYIASASAVFWVKVPSVPSGNKIIYMYYGHGAASSASDGDATFIFFDDFSGDLSKWTIDPENTDKVYIDSLQGNSAPALRHDPDSSQTKNGYFDTRLMTSSYTMGNGIIEYDVFLAGTPRIIHQLGFRVNSLSFTNGYCWRMQNSTTDGGWLRFNNGSWSKIGTNWGPTTGGVWHSVKMEIVDTNLTAYIDGGSAIPVIDTNKQTADYLVSHVHGVSLTASSYVLVDNIRVRKYAAQVTYVASGTLASQVLDTGAAGTTWDGLFWDETLPSNTDIVFELRASDTAFNAGDTTPFWNVIGGTSPVITGLPPGRYKQWRAVLSTTDTANTPTLHEVRVYYY